MESRRYGRKYFYLVDCVRMCMKNVSLPQLYLIGLLLFLFSQSPAQIPNLLPDREQPAYCESLKQGTLVKARKDFMLKGNVKTIREMVYGKDSASVSGFPLQRRYEFSDRGYLLLYAEDSLPSDANYNPRIERYQFDSTGTLLQQAVYYTGTSYHRTLSKRILNSEGYVVKETFECLSCGEESKGPVFDYTLNYIWTTNFDTVARRYVYKTAPVYYERYRDDRVPCLYLKQSEGKSAITRGTEHMHQLLNPLGGVFFAYDSSGRAISKKVIDRAIKSSFNIDQLTEWEYNEQGFVSEIKSYSAIVHQQPYTFDLNSVIHITYAQYDSVGNWTRAFVNVEATDRFTGNTNNKTLLEIERVLTYY